MKIALINDKGVGRILDGKVGMTFIVDKFTDTIDNRGQMAHVRDYRFTHFNNYEIWSIGPEGYSLIEE